MKKLYISLLFIAVFGFSFNLKAQEPDATGFIRTYAQPGGMLTFDWIIGIPMGDMNTNFISNTSTRGFSMEYRYLFNDPISVGGGFSWQGFSEKFDRSTYDFDGGAITSTRFNYLYTFPLFVNFHYYPMKSEYIYPFVGINVALIHIDKQDQIGSYYVQDESWQFGLQPEIGALIRLTPGSGFGLIVKGKYTYMLYNQGVFNSLNHFDIHIGASFVF